MLGGQNYRGEKRQITVTEVRGFLVRRRGGREGGGSREKQKKGIKHETASTEDPRKGEETAFAPVGILR